jgi:hypothetical protein
MTGQQDGKEKSVLGHQFGAATDQVVPLAPWVLIRLIVIRSFILRVELGSSTVLTIDSTLAKSTLPRARR